MSLPSSSKTQPMKPAHPKIKRDRVGIFEVAYEKRPSKSFSLVAVIAAVLDICKLLPFGVRLMLKPLSKAPITYMAYHGTFLWKAMAPAFSLYLATVILDQVHCCYRVSPNCSLTPILQMENYMNHRITSSDVFSLQCVVFVWSLSTLMSAGAERLQ